MKNGPGLRLAYSVTFLGLLVGGQSARAQAANAVLTNAVDIISLPAKEAAASRKVSVIGVVTAADAALKGRFFVQDSTVGVFVDNVNGRRPEPGEVVQVVGITHPGAYAPIITAPGVRRIGTATLQHAKPVTIERLIQSRLRRANSPGPRAARHGRADAHRHRFAVGHGCQAVRKQAGARPEPPQLGS